MAESPKNPLENVIIASVLLLIIFALVMTRSKWEPALMKILSQFNNPNATAPSLESYVWNTATIGQPNLFFDTPVQLQTRNIRLPGNARAVVGNMEVLGYSSLNLSIDAVWAVYREGVVLNIKNAEKGAIDNIKKLPFAKNVQYVSEPVKNANIEGVLITGSFQTARNDMGFKAIAFLDNRTMWQIVTLYDLGDPKAVSAVDRIISSARFKS